jgi:hypothetical protein
MQLPALKRWRDVLGWTHEGVIQWSEKLEGMAKTDVPKLTELWHTAEGEAKVDNAIGQSKEAVERFIYESTQ